MVQKARIDGRCSLYKLEPKWLRTDWTDWVWRHLKLFDQGSLTQARAAVREAPHLLAPRRPNREPVGGRVLTKQNTHQAVDLIWGPGRFRGPGGGVPGFGYLKIRPKKCGLIFGRVSDKLGSNVNLEQLAVRSLLVGSPETVSGQPWE